MATRMVESQGGEAGVCGTAGAPSRRSPRDMALDEQPLRWTQRARGRGRRPLSCHAQMRVTRERRRARHGALSEQVCRTRAAWCASEGAARERASKQCGSGGGSMARLGHIQKRSGRKRMLSGRLDLLSFLGPNENASKRTRQFFNIVCCLCSRCSMYTELKLEKLAGPLWDPVY